MPRWKMVHAVVTTASVHLGAQNAANGIALRTRDDMLRLDAMIMTVQLGIRKLLEVPSPIETPHTCMLMVIPLLPGRLPAGHHACRRK